MFTKKEDITINREDLGTLVIKIENAKDKNVFVNFVYRPQDGSITTFHEYLKLFLDQATISSTNKVLIGDFNLNLIDFYLIHSVKIYVNELFRNNLLTLINKHTRITRKSISAINYINKNFVLNPNFNSCIIKTDLSNPLLFL